MAQHEDVLQGVYQDVTKNQIEEYINTHKCKKFICTYDSNKRLKSILGGEYMNYRIIVDEFHVLLNDCSFKVYTEMQLLAELEGHPHVSYVSATPHLDYFLEQIPAFRNLTYYEIEWADFCPVNIVRQECKTPIDAAIKIIHEYQQGIFPFAIVDGEVRQATEAVIFLNSVQNIVNIVLQTGLKPEEVNIITADND